MKPITIKIDKAVIDAYFYMGKLFILTADHRLSMITHQQLFQRYLTNNDTRDNAYLFQTLFSNETLPYQKTYLNDKNFRANFDQFWTSNSIKSSEITIAEEDFTTICALPEQEALDFVIYAQRAFIGNRSGLYECQLSIDGDRVSALNQRFNRVFDSKSINLNPRVGKLLVSTKDNGLFAGSIESLTDRTHISEKAIEPNSVRTGWVNYNFVNYTSSTEADFFLNQTKEDDSVEAANFKIDDGSNQNRKITQIGIERKSLTSTLENADVNDQIIYAFNSLSVSFAITESGKVLYSRFREESGDDQALNAYERMKNIAFDLNKLGYPLSANTVANGTIYEFFDKVMLMKRGHIQEISSMECRHVRTFPSSKWFRNIALTISEECLEIHSIHPYF